MSEYQFVHFIAIDRPLDDEQLEFMQQQSTRATVTRREFTNEYHFGSFHGKSLEMMRRGFDLHVHFANYGIRQLMFRLPYGFPGGDTVLKPYLIQYNLEWVQDNEGPGGVLTIHPESDGVRWDGYFSDLENLLTELTPVRDMLINGDLRPLYLAWLACEPPESPEPPVPAGVGSLPNALRVLANFYELNDDLLHVAAEVSDSVEEPVAKPLPVQAWLEKKSETQRLLLLEKLLTDDSGIVRADTLQTIRKTVKSSVWPVRKTSRTMDDLYRLAEERSDAQRRQEQDAEEKNRKKRFAAMAKNPADTVANVSKLVAMKSTAKYAEAVTLLCELREALGPDIGQEFTASVAAELRKMFPRTNGLVGKLKEKGFL
ncbi:MAG: hypothetical protein R3C17_06210 [Planctomycetaceae bacterium]